MSVDKLTSENLAVWTGAVTQKGTRGRGSNSKQQMTGIKKLRELILELAVRGKLVPQEPGDEAAEVLIGRIAEARSKLIKAKLIRNPKDIDPISEEEKAFREPDGWVWDRLGNLGQIVGGGTPKSADPSCWSDDGVAWLTPADLYGVSEKSISCGRRQLSQKGLDTSSATLMPKGTVLFSSRAPIGYVAIAGAELATNQGFKSCVPYLEGLSEYLYYFLRRSASQIEAAASGTTFKEISGSGMARICVPVPPLAEQHRIVAKVDELMALCDQLEHQQSGSLQAQQTLIETLLRTLVEAGDANDTQQAWNRIAEHFDTLFTTEESIDQLKQTVLQLAATGKLVDRSGAWKASALVDVAAAVVDCPHSTPKWTEIGEICVRTSQFKPGQLDLTDSRFVSAETYAERTRKIEPKPGDILYSREGGILGVACRVPPETKLCLGQRMLLIRTGERLTSEFLELVLNSPLIREIAQIKTTGGAAPRVNVSTVKNYPIPTPPIVEQNRIVDKVADLTALCDTLKARIQQAQITQAQLADAIVEQAVA